jgi:bacterioferritin-associated ferredoxin
MRININCVIGIFLIAFLSFRDFQSPLRIVIVCLCNPVTDRQIRHCATDGCSSFREMAARLGVAKQCGRCACMAKQLFDAAREAPTATSDTPATE